MQIGELFFTDSGLGLYSGKVWRKENSIVFNSSIDHTETQKNSLFVISKSLPFVGDGITVLVKR